MVGSPFRKPVRGAVSNALKTVARHAQPGVALVERAQLGEGGVGRAGQRGEPVEERQLVIFRRLVGAGHGAPDVPGQHLHVVERRDVAHQVAGDKPEAAQVEDAELRRIGVSRAALRPGVARDHEAVARHVEEVEVDRQLRPLQLVDLRIDENPAALSALFQYSQTQWSSKRPAIEIGAEAATGTGRHTLGAQHGDQQHGEMPADADEALVDRTSGGKRPAVLGEQALQHPLHGADVRLALRSSDSVTP